MTLSQFEKKARELDDADELKHFKELFCPSKGIYLCNNSLGLPPKNVPALMQKQLDRWSELGVEGWFEGDEGWYTAFDRPLREPLSSLLGALYEEVIFMNSLTVNLHLLLVSFYQPKLKRTKILIESPIFPSDLYALKSHAAFHGLDPEETLLVCGPPAGEDEIRMDDLEKIIEEQGDEIALVYLSCVNFITGQVIDMERIAKAARSKGCLVGYDLAHAAGNVCLKLHAWEVDFAVGCSYKYLNGGPGSVGIAFVHEKHFKSALPRFSGWWGNDPASRFQMQLQPEFIPYGGAHSWQLSTPSVFALTPLLASMEMYQKAGIENLRKKSLKQTEFLLQLLDAMGGNHFKVITPREEEKRGSQLSLFVKGSGEKCVKELLKKRVTCDLRPPDIIRVTPSPFFTTFEELLQFAHLFSEI